jgi:trimethylamine-N-oxide reductase (cytochrome c)
VTERLPRGTVHSYESSAVYDPMGTPGESLDRGGCVNQLTPKRSIAAKVTGTAANSCLVQVVPWDGKPHRVAAYADAAPVRAVSTAPAREPALAK